MNVLTKKIRLIGWLNTFNFWTAEYEYIKKKMQLEIVTWWEYIYLVRIHKNPFMAKNSNTFDFFALEYEYNYPVRDMDLSPYRHFSIETVPDPLLNSYKMRLVVVVHMSMFIRFFIIILERRRNGWLVLLHWFLSWEDVSYSLSTFLLKTVLLKHVNQMST